MSTSTPKFYSAPIEEAIARQLLNSTGCTVDINGKDLLLGDALLAAAGQLKDLVDKANDQLEGNMFAKIIAEHLATSLNKRGGAEIAVTENGSVQLFVGHRGNPRILQKPKRKRNLPLIKELKTLAADLGVTIPPEFGIKRSQILEYLTKVENGEIKVKGPSASSKKAAPVQVANDPLDVDGGPMSAGPDETKTSVLEETPLPKKRGFVKTSDAVLAPIVIHTTAEASPPSSPPQREEKLLKLAVDPPPKGHGKTMRQLVEESKDVSIADLLASEPPK